MEAAVNIEDLGHAYGDGKYPVLQDISFSIAEGEFFIIIGPNGSGKTTLLKLISGIANPIQGQIDVLGKPLNSYPRRKLAHKIAMVPQLSHEDFPFTVMDIVLMGRSPHLGLLGIENDTDRQLARDAMRFTGIEPLANRKLDQLSGGERQRVSIARAICQQPDIILLDEPTAALDLAHQVKIMDLMEHLVKQDGYTVVMVSHDLNLAAMYADRILLLNQGKIFDLGPPGQVLTFEKLERVYGCTLLVDNNPLGDCPRLIPVPGRYRHPEKPDDY
jgi:cobalamin transport system ATP-binding protein